MTLYSKIKTLLVEDSIGHLPFWWLFDGVSHEAFNALYDKCRPSWPVTFIYETISFPASGEYSS